MSRFLFLILGSILLASCQLSRESQGSEMDNLQVIVTSLKRIQEEGGSDNFVIFLFDKERNYYIQFAGSRGETELHAEVVSNQFLVPEYELTEDKINLLKTNGWNSPSSSPDGSPNFYRSYEASTDGERQNIAREILRTMTEVYGFDLQETVNVELVLE